jgi:hypothetical protein
MLDKNAKLETEYSLKHHLKNAANAIQVSKYWFKDSSSKN